MTWEKTSFVTEGITTPITLLRPEAMARAAGSGT